MRLRQRMNVDLPQPDGPMIAVTALGAIVRSMPWSTCSPWNHALSEPTRMPSIMRSPRSAEAAARRQPGRQAHHEHHPDEDEGPGPRLAMPVVVGRDRVGEDLQRQRGDRLVEPMVPEPLAEGG